MTKHKQVTISVGPRTAEVDEGIAPLITELWKAGLQTVNSCQENRPGIVWVQFSSIAHGKRFLNVVVPGKWDVDGLYNRIIGDWGVSEEEPAIWEYAALPFDVNWYDVLEGEEDYDDHRKNSDCLEYEGGLRVFTLPRKIDFSLSVRFPKSDFDEVVRRMKAYNNRGQTPCSSRRSNR